MARVPITDIYNAFRGAGFSDAQARALAAETGRETGLQSRYIYGTHSDPANRATNFGLMSFQGDRRTQALDYLRQAGRIGEGGQIIPGPETLRAQAQFIKREMETNPAYARTREQFLANPNIDPEQAAEVLGRNYIRWRFNDPKYAHHHETRRQFLASIPAGQQSPDLTQGGSPISPEPMTPAPYLGGPKMAYAPDVMTQAQRFGSFLTGGAIPAPEMIPQEQADLQARQAAESLRQQQSAIAPFQAMMAAGMREDAMRQRPMSLLQPNFVRGQYSPIQTMRGLL